MNEEVKIKSPGQNLNSVDQERETKSNEAKLKLAVSAKGSNESACNLQMY